MKARYLAALAIVSLAGCQQSPKSVLEEAVRKQSPYPDSVEITSAYQGLDDENGSWVCGTFDSVDVDALPVKGMQVVVERKTKQTNIWKFTPGEGMGLVVLIPVCDAMHDFPTPLRHPEKWKDKEPA